MAKKPEFKERKFFRSFYNPISFAGAFLAALSFGMILFLFLADLVSAQSVPYLGILAFIVFPVFLIIGLILIPIGMYGVYRRRARGQAFPELPRLDMNDPRHRRSVIFFASATAVILLFTGIGTFRAFEFSNSNTFCGEVCHKVMEPEYTAYQTSAHARVKCVECHVGSGATWFVRSKLSGAYQVYSVLFNKYERPIPTPISNLRPAQETCEQCHWPAKFYAAVQSERVHYLADEANTRWKINLLLKIGGGTPELGHTSGIHWHMNISNKIEYVALDERRQQIPWVRATDRDGNVRVFTSEETPVDDAALDTLSMRRMDCMDCHNRPSHVFNSPQIALNNSLENKKIDPALPNIKSAGMDALTAAGEAATAEQALAMIETNLLEYYEANYPEVVEQRKATLKQAIAEIKAIYRRNFFPTMRANWKAYPTDIGHLTSLGCYRCHDGKHKTADGTAITNECTACHLIIEQGDGKTVKEENLSGLEFHHPEDIDEEWKTTPCYECHGAE